MTGFRCGHPRTPENTTGAHVPQCFTCCHARIRARCAATEERNKSILAAFREGVSIPSLAARYGLSPPRIRAIMRDLGAFKSATPIDPEFPKRALELAAELAGANVSQLCSWWRSPKQLIHARWAVMAAMRRRGVSYPRIGKHVGRDHSTVKYGIAQADLLARRSREFAEMLAKVDAA